MCRAEKYQGSGSKCQAWGDLHGETGAIDRLDAMSPARRARQGCVTKRDSQQTPLAGLLTCVHLKRR